jgi:hypothetical protein
LKSAASFETFAKMQLAIRFVVGGLIVSAFAALGDTLKPKSFAGLFGAAPSVALATLGLTVFSEGRSYAALEARSMIAGAVGMIVYAWLTMQLIKKLSWSAMTVSTLALIAWFVCSVGIWYAVLK